MARRPDGRTVFAAALAALALVSAPARARAQTPPPPSAQDLEARRALLERVREARAAGRHAEALDLVERAGQIQTNSSIHRVAAQELAALGRTAEAFARANECVSTAEREPPSGPRDVVLGDCRELATALRDRVGRVVVSVQPAPPEGVSVRVGGRVIPAALWGVPYPVDPGAVRVEAVGPSGRVFLLNVNVSAGASVPVALTYVPRAREFRSASGGGAVSGGSDGEGHSPVGLVVGAVGVAGLLAAGVLELVATLQYDSLRGACTNGMAPCDSAQNFDARRQSIVTLDNAATGAAVAGGVLLVAGGALYFLLHGSGAGESSVRVRVVPSLAGVTVQGTF